MAAAPLNKPKPLVFIFKFTFNFIIVIFNINHSQGEEAVAQFLRAVADDYFRNGTIAVIYSQNSQDAVSLFHDSSTLRKEFPDCILKALMKNSKWSFEVVSYMAHPVPAFKQRKNIPREAVLVLLQNPEAFERIVRIIQTKRYLGPNTKVLIIVDDIDDVMISMILRNFWENLRALNTYVVVRSECQSLFYEWAPFSEEPKIFLINTWTQNLTTNFSIFPDKISLYTSNMTLKTIILPDNEPFVIIYDGSDRRPDGVCLRIISALTSSLNLKLNTVEINDPDIYMPYNQKGEFAGFLGLLQQEFDFACGSLALYTSRQDGSDFLPEYARTYLQWHIAIQKIPRWKTLVIEFSVDTWILVISVWLIISILTYINSLISSHRYEFSLSLLEIFGVIIEKDMRYKPKEFRRFLWLFLLYCMIINSAYKSTLISILTTPIFEKQVENLREAMDSGYSTIFHDSVRPSLQYYSTNPEKPYRMAVEQDRATFLPSTTDMLNLTLRNPSSMSLVESTESQLLILRYFTENDGISKFYSLQDYVVILYKYIFLSPGHPLLDILSNRMSLLSQSGIVEQWFKEINHGYMLTSMFNQPSASTRRKASIQMSHVNALFYVYLACIFLSLLVFTLEKLYRYRQMRKQRKN